MDAAHFRNRAAKAREMARAGEDARLAQMLLQVAADMDAEADAIDAGIDCPGKRSCKDDVAA